MHITEQFLSPFFQIGLRRGWTSCWGSLTENSYIPQLHHSLPQLLDIPGLRHVCPPSDLLIQTLPPARTLHHTLNLCVRWCNHQCGHPLFHIHMAVLCCFYILDWCLLLHHVITVPVKLRYYSVCSTFGSCLHSFLCNPYIFSSTIYNSYFSFTCLLSFFAWF